MHPIVSPLMNISASDIRTFRCTDKARFSVTTCVSWLVEPCRWEEWCHVESIFSTIQWNAHPFIPEALGTLLIKCLGDEQCWLISLILNLYLRILLMFELPDSDFLWNKSWKLFLTIILQLYRLRLRIFSSKICVLLIGLITVMYVQASWYQYGSFNTVCTFVVTNMYNILWLEIYT